MWIGVDRSPSMRNFAAEQFPRMKVGEADRGRMSSDLRSGCCLFMSKLLLCSENSNSRTASRLYRRAHSLTEVRFGIHRLPHDAINGQLGKCN